MPAPLPQPWPVPPPLVFFNPAPLPQPTSPTSPPPPPKQQQKQQNRVVCIDSDSEEEVRPPKKKAKTTLPLSPAREGQGKKFRCGDKIFWCVWTNEHPRNPLLEALSAMGHFSSASNLPEGLFIASSLAFLQLLTEASGYD
jgi:hypothetical protein